MRTVQDVSSPIWQGWVNGKGLVGASARPNAYVTVEPGFYLNTFATTKTQFMYGPTRWYQRADNSQTEIDIPNIQTIDHTYSIENDAATCTITLLNTQMLPLGQAGTTSDYGLKGALTFDRGTRDNRWGFQPNEWQDLLSVNALIRTYQGYGGVGKSRQQAIADGNVILTGVWLVDQVDIATGSKLSLSCRGMGKLLVDQQVFPPLIPYAYYPISWVAPGNQGIDEPAVNPAYGTSPLPSVATPTATGRVVRGIQASPDGAGYWLVGSDGGVFCQPVGTMVRVPVKRSTRLGYIEVPIESLAVGDRVVSYGIRSRLLRRSGSPIEAVHRRPFIGELITVRTSTGHVSQYTPDHHCVASLGNALKDKYVVYLMRRGSQYRIGRAKGRRDYRAGSQREGRQSSCGVVQRCKEEGGDAFWVLSVHDDVPSAALAEGLAAHEFNIPSWRFGTGRLPSNVEGGMSLPQFWAKVGDNNEMATQCLKAHGLRIDAPFWDKVTDGRPSWTTHPRVVLACNLVDGMQVFIADRAKADRPGPRSAFFCRESGAVEVTVTREWYDGEVISLQVAKDHSYVADGIVTHNCYGYEHFYGSATGKLATNTGVTESYGAVPPDLAIGMAVAADGGGYYVATNNGNVFGFGSVEEQVSVGLTTLTSPGPIIAIEAASAGFLLVDKIGHVYTFGTAFHGGTPALVSGATIVAVTTTPDGGGYWMCDNSGRVYTFGNAQYFGNAPSGAANTITGMERSVTGNGYYLVGSDGGVFAFGDAPYFGSMRDLRSQTITLTDVLATLNGQSLVSYNGSFSTAWSGATITGPGIPANTTIQVSNAFDASIDHNYTQDNTSLVNVTVDIAAGGNSVYSTARQWLASDRGSTIDGNGIPTGSTLTEIIDAGNADLSTIETASAVGETAVLHRNSPITVTLTRGAQNVTLAAPITDISVHPDGLGYWLVGEDGGVFTFAQWIYTQQTNPGTTMQFYGSMPGPFTLDLIPNYNDLTDIVRAFLLWSGFYLHGGDVGSTASVYGVLESTGTHSTALIDASTMDKKPVIDAIKTIRSIVGYLFWVDDQGAAIFREPNWWRSGNVLPNGSRTDFLPTIDERTQITTYTRSVPDKDLRSQIVVASDDPFPDTGGGAPSGTVTSVWPPTIMFNTITGRPAFSGPNGEYGYGAPAPSGTVQWVMPDGRQAWYFVGGAIDPGNAAALTQWTTDHAMQAALRGMVEPGMWLNPAFLSQQESDIMVQLIALHIFFRSNLGQVSMLANPMIQIDDQLIIQERETFENRVHYVRSIETKQDLKTGEYTQALTTNILSSTTSSWQVTRPSGAPGGNTVVARVV